MNRCLYQGRGSQKFLATSVQNIQKRPKVNNHLTGKNSPNLVTLMDKKINVF
jgi:hypothetical protein